MSSTINFSNLQENIFSFVKEGSGSAFVNAAAGSGKTTTIIESCKFTKGSSVFLAFNKSIATELSSRLPSYVDSLTLHSLGFSILRSKFRKMKVSGYKVNNILKSFFSIDKTMDKCEMRLQYVKIDVFKEIVSKVKNLLVNVNNPEEIEQLLINYSIDLKDVSIQEVKNLLPRIMDKDLDESYYIDFDDMIYRPVKLGLVSSVKYDNIFIDESQDLNICQMNLLSMIDKGNSRFFFVGDRKQSIYGFRGADHEAVEKIISNFNCQEFPLSISYRCPKAVVNLIKEEIDNAEISCSETAIEGTVSSVKDTVLIDLLKQDVDTRENPMVLSRVNAPLFGIALQCISNGIKASIKGKDFESKLLSYVKDLQNDDDHFESITETIHNYENKKLKKIKYNENLKSQVSDTLDCIRIMADCSNSFQDLIDNIERLFHESSFGVQLSSVHRAKGLENNIVYIVKPEKLPLTWEKQKEWEYSQEKNIQYVAYSRAKRNLIFVQTTKS
jgi:DNA helicase-2/ATP-dependent DNA helicase PcrA